MTGEEVARVLAGGQIITDEQRDAATRCPICKTSHPVKSMVEICEKKAKAHP